MSTGDCSILASSAGGSKLEIKGEGSVGANIGVNGIIKGVKGTWITLAEYKWDYDSKKLLCICAKSSLIDGEILKENVFYKLENGEFVEVKD